MAFAHHKRRREKVLRKCAAMRAAKEHRRLERVADAGNWEVVRRIVSTDPRTGVAHEWVLSAAPDGMRVALSVDGQREIAGSERRLRAMLARVMWGIA